MGGVFFGQVRPEILFGSCRWVGTPSTHVRKKITGIHPSTFLKPENTVYRHNLSVGMVNGSTYLKTQGVKRVHISPLLLWLVYPNSSPFYVLIMYLM